MKRTNKKPMLESNFRAIIRREIYKLMEAEEGETEEAPQEEPEQEEGLNADFDEAVTRFIRKVRSSSESVSDDDLIEMVGTIIDTFASSNESKLNILKSIRNNIVR